MPLRRDLVARIVDQRDERRRGRGRPFARHQGVARLVGVLRGADELDDFVDIGDGDGKTDQDVRAVARLAEQELGAPRHHVLAERDEGDQQILQVHHLRAPAVERHHVAAEARLQRREAIELVEHDVGHRFALELDHDAIAFAARFIAQVGDALDLLVAHEFGDALDHRRLVHLIGNFGDDDGFAFLADRLHLDLAAHHDGAAAGVIGRADAGAAENDAAGREIRTRHDRVERFDAERGIVDQRDGGVDHLAEIVRRDIGRHADRDAAGAVDQQIGKLRRQDNRLALRIVVVRPGS